MAEILTFCMSTVWLDVALKPLILITHGAFTMEVPELRAKVAETVLVFTELTWLPQYSWKITAVPPEFVFLYSKEVLTR